MYGPSIDFVSIIIHRKLYTNKLNHFQERISCFSISGNSRTALWFLSISFWSKYRYQNHEWNSTLSWIIRPNWNLSETQSFQGQYLLHRLWWITVKYIYLHRFWWPEFQVVPHLILGSSFCDQDSHRER